MKKITNFLLFSFIIYNLAFIIPVYATDASSSSSPSASLIDKINQLKAEIASKASLIKLEINKKLQNKAVVGIIKEKTDSQVTLTSKNGDRVILVNDYTVYEIQTSINSHKKSSKTTLADFTKDDYIVGLGDVDDKNNLVAKKIIKLDQPSEDSKKMLWGQVQSVTSSTINLKDKDNQTQTLVVSSSADIFGGSDEANLSDIKPSKFLVGVGILNSNKILKADYIYIIPLGGVINLKKIKSASPSATPTVN
ncbi:hypothetical protein HY025_05335 [Candidatus Daviesbacteria bacterium]|nr:hypothetical protein [Candidatus Daviesbacteria bacterium]